MLHAGHHTKMGGYLTARLVIKTTDGVLSLKSSTDTRSSWVSGGRASALPTKGSVMRSAPAASAPAAVALLMRSRCSHARFHHCSAALLVTGSSAEGCISASVVSRLSRWGLFPRPLCCCKDDLWWARAPQCVAQDPVNPPMRPVDAQPAGAGNMWLSGSWLTNALCKQATANYCLHSSIDTKHRCARWGKPQARTSEYRSCFWACLKLSDARR